MNRMHRVAATVIVVLVLLASVMFPGDVYAQSASATSGSSIAQEIPTLTSGHDRSSRILSTEILTIIPPLENASR